MYRAVRYTFFYFDLYCEFYTLKTFHNFSGEKHTPFSKFCCFWHLFERMCVRRLLGVNNPFNLFSCKSIISTFEYKCPWGWFPLHPSQSCLLQRGVINFWNSPIFRQANHSVNFRYSLVSNKLTHLKIPLPTHPASPPHPPAPSCHLPHLPPPPPLLWTIFVFLKHSTRGVRIFLSRKWICQWSVLKDWARSLHIS